MSAVRPASNWILTFDDDFDGPAGSPPDLANWVHHIGGSGWGNNESQSYTDGTQNAFLDGKGNLIIEAREESTKGPDDIERPYSSARLATNGKYSQVYGRIEAKIRLPQGQGIWPALWMLGDNFDEVGWPQCGEIDILESVGKVAKIVHGTIHGPSYSGDNAISRTFESDVSLADDFHVYAIEWAPDEIRWLVDDACFATITSDQVQGHDWVFDHPFFIILNLAIGGNWPGYPDSTTQFPQRLLVDYVRVFEQARE